MSKIFYIINLGQTTDLSELESLFTTIGDVESFRMEVQPGSERRLGVVEMATAQQASDCVLRFNGESAVGQILAVTSKMPRPQIARTR